jgi:glycosyltransferase involved in cell wall biosynthesis
MNVLHIAMTDTGGAGNAAYNIHKLMCQDGINSKMLVFRKTKKDDNVIEFNFSYLSLLRKGFRKLKYEITKKQHKKINAKYNFYNLEEKNNYIPTKYILKHLPFKPDVIVFHSITHFINTKNIYELYKAMGAKMYWQLMDMSPLTGGCHFAWDCKGYHFDCSDCPALSTKKLKKRAFENYKYKNEYLSQTPISIIYSSSTMDKESQASSLFKDKEKFGIFLSVDEERYKPKEMETARKEFDLAVDAKIIFYGAQHISIERKGFKYFLAALDELKKNLTEEEQSKVIILLAGYMDKNYKLPFEVKYVGYIDTDSLISAYQASNLYFCSSIEDSGPVMINEVIMCGTPVVSFNMGVAPDLIKSGKTGYLAALKDTVDIANGLKQVLFMSDIEHNKMSENCRNLALTNFKSSKYSERFLEILNK